MEYIYDVPEQGWGDQFYYNGLNDQNPPEMQDAAVQAEEVNELEEPFQGRNIPEEQAWFVYEPLEDEDIFLF